MNPLEQLKSVLCDLAGKCCIAGSDEDRAIVDRALQTLAEQPAREPLTPEWYARWIRNNYQDYWNIATLCDEMTKAAHGIKENT